MKMQISTESFCICNQRGPPALVISFERKEGSFESSTGQDILGPQALYELTALLELSCLGARKASFTCPRLS